MRVPGVRFVQGRNRYGTSTKYGIAVHATANTAAAADEAQYATRRTDGTSSHFYADDVEVIQSLDTNDRAGHAGSTQGNTYAISVEFTGLNSWSRAKWLSSVAWELVGAVLAAVTRAHNIPATRATVAQMKTNPQVRGAYDHNQMRLAWGGTDHTDPGPNFPWDHLLAVWQRHLNPAEDDMAGEIADKALAQLDGRNALGEVYLRLLEGRSGVDAKYTNPNNLKSVTAKVDALTTQVAELAARPAPGTVVISDEQFERVLRKVVGSVDSASPAS